MSPPSPVSARVLVVDDDEGLLELLRRALTRAGYAVETRSCGSEALERVEAGDIDLLVLDFRLPDMEADTLVDTLRHKGLDTPFVVVTGQGDEQVAVEMMKRGARDYVVKGPGLLERLNPVTERVLNHVVHEARLEAQEQALRRKESLAKLGEMAAVVAHEVKNPLAAISGAVQVIGNQLDKENPQQEVVQEVLEQIDRLDDTVNELLFFARPRPPQPGPVPLASLLKNTTSLLLHDRGYNELLIQVEGPDAPARGDPRLLERAFLNVLLNAGQAQGGRGEIRVEIAVTGSVVRVVLTDSGPGIPEGDAERIWEPFVTTKTRGTGLGLPTTRRIVEAHGGSVRLLASPNGGTQAVVELPLWGFEAPVGPPAK